MTLPTTPEQIADAFIASLPEAYQDYLRDQKLEDNAVNQLGFLSAVMQILQEEGPASIVVERFMTEKLVVLIKEATEKVRELVRNKKK